MVSDTVDAVDAQDRAVRLHGGLCASVDTTRRDTRQIRTQTAQSMGLDAPQVGLHHVVRHGARRRVLHAGGARAGDDRVAEFDAVDEPCR